MKQFTALVLLLSFYLTGKAQDTYTHVFFANQTELPITLQATVSGNTGSVQVRKQSLLPFEITHNHLSAVGDIITVGDFLNLPDKDHNEDNSTLRCERVRQQGNNNYAARVEVRTGSSLLFSVLVEAQDVPGPQRVTMYYNVEHPGGQLELPSPGLRIQDNAGTQARVAEEIIFNGSSYKLVYGVFDENRDNTDNLIFSLSKVVDTIFRFEPPLSDTLDPDILNIYCYNPGILMPLGISDQDENERTKVFWKAMPKNMDILVFQEFFEPQKVNQIMNDLSPWYPYHTGRHNRPLIPGIGKDGGVRIVSRYPILEERDISFSENGCIPEDFFSLFANKGVKYAKINKQGQMIHVFGTHTSIQPCDLYVMGEFIAGFDIPEEDIVIMAGDFNVDMNRFDNGSDDYTIMLDTLNAIEPTYLSFLNPRSYSGTTSGLNHFYCCNPEGRQHLDYVFVSAKHKLPYLLSNRSMQARLNEPDESFGIFDMGDHEPVYARIAFPALKAEQENITGCAGNTVRLKANLDKAASLGGTFHWFRNGEELPGELDHELEVAIISTEDFGEYRCEYRYIYRPDTSVNNYFDPAYMQYQWIFRGNTEGRISAGFRVDPASEDPECAGTVTGISESDTRAFTIYPNPAENYIEISGYDPGRIHALAVMDLFGRVLLKHEVVQHTYSTRIDISGLSYGNYIVRGTGPDGTSVSKFIKVK
jgi:endonuclease/exonuclease/phosphatase family metal-dependent hydrolase